MGKATRVSKEKAHQEFEGRFSLCANLIRRSRFWYMVSSLSVTGLLAIVILKQFQDNASGPKTWAYIITYLVPIVFFVSTFMIYRLPLRLHSIFKLKREQYVGLAIVLLLYPSLPLLAGIAPIITIYSLWFLFFMCPVVPLVTARGYVRLTAPYAIQLARSETDRLSKLVSSPHTSRKSRKRSMRRLSFYIDLIVGSADESALEQYLAIYHKLSDIRSGSPGSPAVTGGLAELSGLISQLPLTSKNAASSKKSAPAEDIDLCNRYDAGVFYIRLATHWKYPYLKIRRNYLRYLITHPRTDATRTIGNPRNQFEKKLKNDHTTYRSWEKESNDGMISWLSMTIIYGIVVSYYNTNIRMPEVYRAGIELYPSFAAIGGPPPFPDIFLQTYSAASINTFLYFFYFVPFTIVNLILLRAIERYSISQKPPILSLNSRLFTVSVFFTLYFPIWRIISETPTFLLELLISFLLAVVMLVALFRYLVSSWQRIRKMVNISDSIVVVNLMDVYFALQENDLQARTKEVSKAVKRTKHFLWFLKLHKRTGDRAANLTTNRFFDAFSSMLSLVLANNAIPSEKDHLNKEISKIIYACVMRNYRDIEMELPSRYREALELLDVAQRRRERVYNTFFRPVLGILLTILVYIAINRAAAWMPGLMQFIGNLADIRGLFGF
jgi:Ca2+/Na+ antiporter